MKLLDPTWDGEVTRPDGTSARAVQLARHAGAARLGATLYELDRGAAASPLHPHHATRSSCFSGAPTLRTARDAEGRLPPGRSWHSDPAATAPSKSSTTPTARPRAHLFHQRSLRDRPAGRDRRHRPAHRRRRLGRTARRSPGADPTMNDTVNLAAKLALLERPYSPGIIGHLNDLKLMVVKARGEFIWHKHDDSDDFFLVLNGRLTIRLRDRDVHLDAGELFVVPRGVEHCPIADEEAHILLIEPVGTPNTGDAGGERTAPERTI